MEADLKWLRKDGAMGPECHMLFPRKERARWSAVSLMTLLVQAAGRVAERVAISTQAADWSGLNVHPEGM